MKYVDIILALEIMRECDSLSITEDDKKLIISVFGNILKLLREAGLVTAEISANYAILKDSTWNNGYFCIVTKRMCSLVFHVVNICPAIFDI